ncbi:NAD(P)/FAD-dependent oxidoreductase [Brachybacterium sp. EF45031]|uniref:dihydrolipoyl dehydrogenase family protein n=1 Tax=Brachybacterium sillae TaxID=2810536 RepID=UPI00217CEE5E|nr:NAD(P)/FAD-dependent oxidoreductase [Brachybacterium sillae]MCS6711529.1 NAD(P)/FAD-dependent oxidoreductase [Brachybacterium sillae]
MTTTSTAPAPDRTVDVVVIGAGPVGENVAQYAIEGTEATALLVEEGLVGGECSYYACMPSKALLGPLAVARTTELLPGVSTARPDRDALLERRDVWVSQYDDSGQVEWAEGAGIPVLRGRGRLVGERRVEVTAPDGSRTVVEARRAVVLATGSTPVIPEAVAQVAPWTSRDATGVVEVPGRLAIIGGGVVAVEAATWMQALGAQVTMLIRGERLLSRFEPFVGEAVRAALEARGVTVRTGVAVSAADRPTVRQDVGEEVPGVSTGLGRLHGGPVRLHLGADILEADEVLVATGRRPALDDLGLDTVGIDPCTVTDATDGLPSWLHLVGDASGETPLTHWGKYRARVIGERIAASLGAPATAPAPVEVPVPQVVFTDPQVATVGLTEAAAREAHRGVVTATVPYGSAAGTSLLRDEVQGTASIVVDSESGLLLGATFVGPECAELIHAATVAIVGRVPVSVLRHAVPSYPTASELWLRLLEELPRELR